MRGKDNQNIKSSRLDVSKQRKRMKKMKKMKMLLKMRTPKKIMMTRNLMRKNYWQGNMLRAALSTILRKDE
jgi:hypothetical protein